MAVDQKYYFPTGGLPGQKDMMTQRAVFTQAYAVIPRGTMRDIVTSFLPHWHILAIYHGSLSGWWQQ